MSYCTDCIHYKVCGNEGVDDSAMTFCADKQTNGDLISRNSVICMFNTMDRYRADKLILQDTDREFPSNEVFIVDDCYELLEQLPTYSAEQTDGDLISRQDVLDIISDVMPIYSDNYHYILEQRVKNLLSIGSTAEWTKDDECSNCGKYVYVGDRDNYCPHCGARMKGVKK